MNMKRTLLLAAGLLLMLGGSAFASNPEPFSVSITIRQAITVTKQFDLDFGTVEAVAGTYTVTADANPQTGAGVGATAAQFDVTGEAGQSATAVFGSNPLTITCVLPCSGGSASVSLSTSTTPFPLSGGTDAFYVGGSVTLTGAEPAGFYTNSTTLTLLYQ
jgi:Domain of unknown function (DUF4402)